MRPAYGCKLNEMKLSDVSEHNKTPTESCALITTSKMRQEANPGPFRFS